MVDEERQAKCQRFNNKVAEFIAEFTNRTSIELGQMQIVPEFETMKDDLLKMIIEFQEQTDIPIYSIEIEPEPEFLTDGTKKINYQIRMNFKTNEPDSIDPGEVGEQESTT